MKWMLQVRSASRCHRHGRCHWGFSAARDRYVDPRSSAASIVSFVGGDGHPPIAARTPQPAAPHLQCHLLRAVRTYEIFCSLTATPHEYRVLADQGVVSNLLIDNGGDVLKPWSMRRGERILRADETANLVPCFRQAAAFGRRATVCACPTSIFWWTVASCQDGVWGSGVPLSDRRLRKREVRAATLRLGSPCGAGQRRRASLSGRAAPRSDDRSTT